MPLLMPLILHWLIVDFAIADFILFSCHVPPLPDIAAISRFFIDATYYDICFLIDTYHYADALRYFHIVIIDIFRHILRHYELPLRRH